MKEETKKMILKAQKNEITEYLIYKKLAGKVKDNGNKEILIQIAEDEKKHYDMFKEHSETEVKPNKIMVWFYYLTARVLGLAFGLKLMEKGEELAQINYDKLSNEIPEAKDIEKDENRHEMKLLNMIREEKLSYVGSIVLGLSDALVELTGALAGFTFALQNGQLIAVAGLITGVAASLSMAASEYLSTKSEESELSPVKSSIYTGIAYFLTVIFLIFPYLVLSSPFVALIWTLVNAIIIILIFTFYISVAKDLSFKHRFSEMAAISLGVALISFGIGFLIRNFIGIDI
jgi:VIT1/CCC1 family predicted Fe2+/Mn2+ transporter